MLDRQLAVATQNVTYLGLSGGGVDSENSCQGITAGALVNCLHPHSHFNWKLITNSLAHPAQGKKE